MPAFKQAGQSLVQRSRPLLEEESGVRSPSPRGFPKFRACIVAERQPPLWQPTRIFGGVHGAEWPERRPWWRAG